MADITTPTPTPDAPLGSLAYTQKLTQGTNALLGKTAFDTTTGAPIAPPNTGTPGQPTGQKTAAQIQAETDKLASQPIADNTNPTRTSSKIESDFQSYLDKLGAPPTPPDSNSVQTNAETSLGVDSIKQNITTLNDQYTALTNDLQNRQATEASKPGVVATIINGRMQMLSAEDSKALNDLKARISSANTDYKNANTAVQSIMKNAQTDYTNASKAYNDAYTKAYQVFTSAESQLTKEQASASANAKVIISSFKGSSTGIHSITPEQETEWNNLELQAGLPTGFIKAAVQAELNVDKWVKGTDGNMYVQGYDANGVPFTAKVGSVGGTKDTNPSDQKIIDNFNKDLSVSTQLTRTTNPITREQFIRQLQSKYPQINPDQIQQAVYKTYPDNFNK